jgi:hypothetical protein
MHAGPSAWGAGHTAAMEALPQLLPKKEAVMTALGAEAAGEGWEALAVTGGGPAAPAAGAAAGET